MQDPATKPACSDSSRLLFATDAALVCRRGAAVAGLGLSAGGWARGQGALRAPGRGGAGQGAPRAGQEDVRRFDVGPTLVNFSTVRYPNIFLKNSEGPSKMLLEMDTASTKTIDYYSPGSLSSMLSVAVPVAVPVPGIAPFVFSDSA